MTTADQLLPGNSGAFERAVAKAASDTLPVPIAEIMNPATTPAPFVPFIAAHESVDLWFDDWSLDRKRLMNGDADLPSLKGTVAGPARYLAYVDGEIVHRVVYPSPFVMGRAAIGRTPIGLPSFVARYLVKVPSKKPLRGFVMGRAVLGRARLKAPSRQPFARALIALRVAKAPETEARVDFAHKRLIRLSDAIPIDGSHVIGGYVDRRHL